MSKGMAEASDLFNFVAKLGRQMFYSMTKLGQRAVQLGGQAWSASCSAWWQSLVSELLSLAIEFNTCWPSLATKLFNLATKLGQQIFQLGGQAPLANQSRSTRILLTPASPSFSQETGAFFCF
ncbi:hypothetical protein PCANC_17862 [Puccinia coronata f. sp. avenae]|uniref:Uncharacterized protein n=1 Tax=Puccinia coronata f. sp. avenae TaxID=200324 RepID=A0A2N5U6V5_9BASI|nr:hypothetical protein PCANC_17862 [Puccinia coronata f. sp. avenae]